MKEKLPPIPNRPKTSNEEVDQRVVQEILLAIRSIGYGSIEVIIHDSRVVQIERREKVRFDKDDSLTGK